MEIEQEKFIRLGLCDGRLRAPLRKSNGAAVGLLRVHFGIGLIGEYKNHVALFDEIELVARLTLNELRLLGFLDLEFELFQFYF